MTRPESHRLRAAGAPAGAAPAGVPDAAPGMARGVTIITFAKAWFVVAGYALYFGLTRMLGPHDFGRYSVVTSIVSVLNNVLIAANLQAVSRFTARDADRAGSVLGAGLRVQAAIGLGLFAILQLAAGVIGGLLRDESLVAPLRIVAFVVPCYALYAVNVGFLNGRRQFHLQGGLDVTYSTLRVALTLGAVVLGLGVAGAVGGFSLAALAILGVSVLLVARQPRPRGEFATRELLRFGGWLFVLTLFANLVLTVDLWAVKRLTDPLDSNRAAGVFRAALTLSQILYQLLIPLALVLFPSLSHLGRAPDPAAARDLVRGALRYLAVTVVPGAALLAAMGPELVGLLYGAAYREGGALLAFLGPAYALWTVAYLLATALSGAGDPRSGALVLGIGAVTQAAACFALFRSGGMSGVALGDLVAMAVALLLGVTLATRRFGSVLPWASLARGAALAVPVYLVARFWPASGALVAVKAGALGLALVGALLATGEIRLPRRPAPPGAPA